MLLTQSARDLFLVDENLDSPILTPAVPCAVVIDRLAGAVRNHANLGRVETLVADEISGDARSAALSELVVVVLMADAVGIPCDHEDALRRRRRGARRIPAYLRRIDRSRALALPLKAAGSGREGRSALESRTSRRSRWRLFSWVSNFSCWPVIGRS